MSREDFLKHAIIFAIICSLSAAVAYAKSATIEEQILMTGGLMCWYISGVNHGAMIERDGDDRRKM